MTLAAPTTFCLDDNYFLLLRRHFQATIRFVLQAPAGPSTCSWSVADLYPGAYDAMILYRKTGEIAATARAEVFAGVSTPMNIEPLRTEVQGTVTVAGLPLEGGVQIKFIDDVIRWEWKASVDAHGNYRANLTSDPNDRVCATVERIQPMNHIRECSTFQAGIERFDIDLLPAPIERFGSTLIWRSPRLSEPLEFSKPRWHWAGIEDHRLDAEVPHFGDGNALVAENPIARKVATL